MDSNTPVAPSTPAPEATPSVPSTPAPDAGQGATPAQPQAPVAPQAPAQPAAPSGDGFTAIDPSTLSPENLAIYKSMQADYTKKTQGIAAMEAKYGKYAPIIDQMLNGTQPGQQVNPAIESMTKQLKEAGYDDDTIRVGKMIAESIFGHLSEQQQQQAVMTKAETAFKTAATEDPRLVDDTLKYDVDGETFTFGDLVEQLVGADPKWHEDALAATRKAVKRVDAMINAAKTQGKQELSSKTTQQAKTFAPTNTSPAGAVNDNTPLSVRDAVLAAQQELGSA